MPKKKIRNIGKAEDGAKPFVGTSLKLGKTKTLTKKTRRKKRADGRDGGFVETNEVVEDKGGTKWKRRRVSTAPDARGGTKDLAEASRRERGYYGQNGKGDAPRNVGPKFHKNFKKIDGMIERKDGEVRSGKFKKVYK